MTNDIWILVAEGGGWPTDAIGPFDSYEEAERYIEKAPGSQRKHLESWGGIGMDKRDLPVTAPDWSDHYE